MKKKIVYYALMNSEGEFFDHFRNSFWFSENININHLYADPDEAAGVKFKIKKGHNIDDLHVKPITISWE